MRIWYTLIHFMAFSIMGLNRSLVWGWDTLYLAISIMGRYRWINKVLERSLAGPFTCIFHHLKVRLHEGGWRIEVESEGCFSGVVLRLLHISFHIARWSRCLTRKNILDIGSTLPCRFDFIQICLYLLNYQFLWKFTWIHFCLESVFNNKTW